MNTIFNRNSLKGLWSVLLLLLVGATMEMQAQSAPPTFRNLVNPAVVVPGRESVPFYVDIVSPVTGATDANATFQVIIPPDWTFVAADNISGWVFTPATPGNNGTVTLPYNLEPGTTTTMMINLQPLCAANPDVARYVYFQLNYKDNNDGNKSVSVNPSNSQYQRISNYYPPVIEVEVDSIPPTIQLGRTGQLVMSITETMNNSYMKYLTVVATPTNLSITKVELSSNKPGATWIDASTLPGFITRVGNKNTYNFTPSVFDVLGLTNSRLDYTEKVFIRETVLNSACTGAAPKVDYTITDICDESITKTSSINSVKLNMPTITYPATSAITYSNGRPPTVNHIRMFPSSSTNNNGSYLLTITNTDNALSVIQPYLRLDVNGASSTVGTIQPTNVYICDAAGNKITALTRTANGGIDYMYPLTNNSPTVIGSNTVLDDADGDGRYNDLMPGQIIYILVEYDFIIKTTTWNPCLPPVATTESIINYLYFKDACGTITSSRIGTSGTESVSSSTYPFLDLGFNKPVTAIKSELQEGETTILRVTESAKDQSYLNRLTLNNNINQTFSITLPPNLVYDGKVMMGATDISANVTWNAPVLTISNRTIFSISSFIYDISVRAVLLPVSTATNGVGDENNKEISFSHSFDWGDSQIRTYSCYTDPVDFTVIPRETGVCEEIFVDSLNVSRTSFGYKHNTLTPITTVAEAKTARVNFNAAGPYDNVDFTINASALKDIALSSEDIFAEVSYSSAYKQFTYQGTATDAFTTLSINGGVAATIPNSTLIFTTDGGGNQIVRINLKDYLGAGVSNTDKIKVTLKLQVVEDNCPTIPTLYNFVGYLYRSAYGRKINCSAKKDNFTLFDYKLTYVAPGAGGSNSYFNEVYTSGNNPISHFTIGSGNAVISATEVFPNEYRPNVIINGLQTNINWAMAVSRVRGLNANIGNQILDPSAYTVVHETNGTTTISWNNSTLYSPELWANKTSVFQIVMDFESVCYTDKNLSTKITYTDYPTSGNPQTNRTKTTLDGTYGTTYTQMGSSVMVFPYKNTFQVIPTQNLLNDSIVWDIAITNNINGGFNATNKVANYGWLAVETTQGGLTNLELWSADGTTKIAGTNDWISYGTGKAWVKLSNVNFTTNPIQYKLKATGVSSGVNIKADLRFGLNRVALPDSPDGSLIGVADGANYYRPANCMETRTSLEVAYVASDFAGTLSIDSLSMDSITGKVEFCNPILFNAKWDNAGSSTLTDLKVKIEVPAQINSSEVFLPITSGAKYKVGTGGWIPVPADVVSTWNYETEGGKRYYVFTLPQDLILGSYQEETSSDNVVFQFAMQPQCGFTDGKLVYGILLATAPGGLVIDKKCTTQASIKIAQFVDTPPTITILDLEINGNPTNNGAIVPVNLTSAATGSNGQIILTGTLSYQATPMDGTEVYIQIPDNLTLDATNSYLKNADASYLVNFTQASNLLSASAQFDIPVIGLTPITYYIQLVLTPTAENWSCETNQLNVEVQVKQDLTCGENVCYGYQSIATEIGLFEMSKSDVSIDHSSVTFVEKYNTTSHVSEVTVTGTVNNNGTSDVENVNLYVYAGNQLATNTVAYTIPLILAGDSATINYTFALEPTGACNLSLILPKTASDNAYICAADSIAADLKYEPGVKSGRICQNELLNLGDPAIPGYSYSWSVVGGNGTFNPGSGNQSEVTYTCSGTASVKNDLQNQILNLTIIRNGGCSAQTQVPVHVVPLESRWEGTGTNPTNWNDVTNWSNGIPDKCTNVLIPDGSPVYPILQAANGTDPTAADYYDQAACAKIVFEHGGEVGQPVYLDYDSAEVHLALKGDLGISNPGQWYMLSAPLQQMYSGDFYVNGSDPERTSWPKVYMMQYQAQNPQTEATAIIGDWTKSFNTANIGFKPGDGFVAWLDLETINAYSGSNYSGYGCFTFPRSNARYKVFSKEDGITTSGATFPKAGNPALGRNAAHRFIYEPLVVSAPVSGKSTQLIYDAPFSMPVSGGSAYETIIVGNPFMSHLDFMKLYTENTGLFEDYYYLWTGTSFDVNTLNWTTDLSTPHNNLIAPMQSFIIKKKTNITSLNINPAMSVTHSCVKLRSERLNTDLLNVEVRRNDQRQSALTLVYDDNQASNASDSPKDVNTLFNSSESNSAVVYTPVAGKAMSIRTANFREPIELCIRTAEKGMLSLQINGLDNFAPGLNIYLEDRINGIVQDLREEPVYSFNNETGNVEGRFFLQISGESTGWEVLNEGGISIYAENGTIHAVSGLSDPIRSVEIIGLQGQSLLKEAGLNTSQTSYSLNSGRQVVIVKVKTEKTQRIEKVLVK